MTNEMPFLPRSKWQREPESPRDNFIIILIALILAGIIIFGVKTARAEVVDLNTIKQIESAGNPLAVSRTGAVGLYQIMPCVLSEYNQFNKSNHSRPDLFNPAVNEKIAKWYLEVRIPQMLKHYGKAITTTNCITAYNAGIRAVVKGYLPKETANYLQKYARLTNE